MNFGKLLENEQSRVEETAEVNTIKLAIMEGLKKKDDTSVPFIGEELEQFELLTMVVEAVVEAGEKEVKKATESVAGTAIKLFQAKDGVQSVVIRSNNICTYVVDGQEPITINVDKWGEFEQSLVDVGTTSVTTTEKNPTKWIKILKVALKIGKTVVTAAIIAAIVILVFKAAFPLTTGLFSGIAQYTPWGEKLLSIDGLKLFRDSIGAEMKGTWLTAKVKQ